LEKTLSILNAEDMIRPGVAGAWSVKDILAHLTAWERLFLDWYSSGLQGSTPNITPVGMSQKSMDALNQQIYEQNRDAAWMTSWLRSCFLPGNFDRHWSDLGRGYVPSGALRLDRQVDAGGLYCKYVPPLCLGKIPDHEVDKGAKRSGRMMKTSLPFYTTSLPSDLNLGLVVRRCSVDCAHHPGNPGVSWHRLEVLAGKRVYLAVYIEIVSVGLLPVLFAWICKDDLVRYGFARHGLAKSLLLSALFVGVMFGIGYLTTGRLMTDDRPALQLDFPWNAWYGLSGIFAWGPLEVFFFIWLVDNTEDIFKRRMGANPWGLILTVLSFALIHVLTTDVRNALYTGAIFLILGLIYKYAKNIAGPMLAWTLVNGQVWYMARLLL
jgi:hypothetical protein